MTVLGSRQYFLNRYNRFVKVCSATYLRFCTYLNVRYILIKSEQNVVCQGSGCCVCEQREVRAFCDYDTKSSMSTTLEGD